MGEAFPRERRLTLLRGLAAKAGWRHDTKIPLTEDAPSLDIQGFAGGFEYADKDNPQYDGGSELSYDYNAMEEEGFIQHAYMKMHQDSYGSPIYSESAVKLTLDGLRMASDPANFEKSMDTNPSQVEKGKVFIVHGHDNEVKQSVARLVERLDLKAVILHEQTNRGRTVIEKFEAHSDADYAIILLTPDDVGSSKKDHLLGCDLKPRARQTSSLS